MVSIGKDYVGTIEVSGVNKNIYRHTLTGKSTETKPTGTFGRDILAESSFFIETDTGEVYVYGEANSTWSVFGGE